MENQTEATKEKVVLTIAEQNAMLDQAGEYAQGLRPLLDKLHESGCKVSLVMSLDAEYPDDETGDEQQKTLTMIGVMGSPIEISRDLAKNMYDHDELRATVLQGSSSFSHAVLSTVVNKAKGPISNLLDMMRSGK